MKKLLLITVPYAIGIGLASGLVYLALGEWRFASLAAGLLGFVLFFGAWFPFVLAPYLRGREK